jgi:RND superfamily putative drug exporter
VTSAAVVIIALVTIFAILPEVIFKQLGVGLAVAVLIDATIVRAVLLQSAMTLLGEWNWYLPPGAGAPLAPRAPAHPPRRPATRFGTLIRRSSPHGVLRFPPMSRVAVRRTMC